jgi:hypothetical protein
VSALTPLEVLKKARELIADPTRWAQGDYERPGPCGTRFCMLGAVYGYTDVGKEAANLLARAVGPGDRTEVVTFNDTAGRKHEEVLAAFDKAIKLAEKEDVS